MKAKRASQKHVSDSEESDVDLLHAPDTPPQDDATNDQSPPVSVLSHRFKEEAKKTSAADSRKSKGSSDDRIAVLIARPTRLPDQQSYRGSPTVDRVLKELKKSNGKAWYKIEYEDGKQQDISIESLVKLRNGQNALDLFNNEDEEEDEAMSSPEKPFKSQRTRARNKPDNQGMVDISKVDFDESEDDEDLEHQIIVKKRKLAKDRVSVLTESDSRRSSRVASRVSSRISTRAPSHSVADTVSSDTSEPEEELHQEKTSRNRAGGRNTRASKAQSGIQSKVISSNRYNDVDELAEEDEAPEETDSSAILYAKPKRKKQLPQKLRAKSPSPGKRGRRPRRLASESSEEDRPQPTRKSGRERQVKSMKEQDMDEDIYADEAEKSSAPKVISIREVFQPVEKSSAFHRFHNTQCDVCEGFGTNSNKGKSPLIHCQGCSSSIHKVCLGYRSNREPMVTKVAHETFVMQCRRCIGTYTKKDSSAPRLDSCQQCGKEGKSCAAFSTKKTTKVEEKLRLENDGDDPVTEVPEELLNNAENVLFRCVDCYRAWHFEHLPPRLNSSKTPKAMNERREVRHKEYTSDWQCIECLTVPAKVQGLVAWRPVDRESYRNGETFHGYPEDEKEYLIKWHRMSYFQCSWMPGAWVWGVTAAAMRKAFVRHEEEENLLPKWSSEEAIPEDYLRMEIIFDIDYSDDYEPEDQETDEENIGAVERVLVKFVGLPYEESVWENPPKPEDTDRWRDFAAAYREYLAGQYFESQPTQVLKARTDTYQTLNFNKKLRWKEQPKSLVGGEMMGYQLEGFNWMLYNFHKQKNVILADEMGLGKTIQVIAFIASLVLERPKCWPFLVVTPNSTCPNWRREIKKWAPGLRVVALYGGKKARDMVMQYELFPDNCRDMRAHVVITSYEGPVGDDTRLFFRRTKWAGLIVDEGQRLKNDANQLYEALQNLNAPFSVLLTGTPIQNNLRELFNMLQFLDPKHKAADLEEKYAEAELNNDKMKEIQNLITPYLLRRTKVEALKFLPPLAQVIIPVSMSLVQKKLYKFILGKNPELIRSIMGAKKDVVNVKERGNLNNILMQLRKCLCHPFIYSSAIEETSLDEAATKRNLIDASSKFQLLEIMLPKLRDRGHRVLIFSQFLDQLTVVEDFLDGLGMPFERLDGKINALEKQKRIDAFNAPNSPLFAFLLSTRAGGVGINLATADTVIIMDPDFNPQQDLQALSRAHRIGQKKKVLVFQLMTKDSAEEKIVQINRKKLALAEVVETLGAADDEMPDLASILAHGAAALFNDDDRNDIRYDSASVDKLLDRTQVENTKIDDKKTAASQFSFAQIWANDKGDLTEDVGDPDVEEPPPDDSFWTKILDEREREAALEAARRHETFGRGKRARQNVDYKRSTIEPDDDVPASSPMKKSKRKSHGSDQESDFDTTPGLSDKEEDDSDVAAPIEPSELDLSQPKAPKEREYIPRKLPKGAVGPDPKLTGYRGKSYRHEQPQSQSQASIPFRTTQNQHVRQPAPSNSHVYSKNYYQGQPMPHSYQLGSNAGPVPLGGYGVVPHSIGYVGTSQAHPSVGQVLGGFNTTQHGPASASLRHCHACKALHITGDCPLKLRGVDTCNLCGLAHFGKGFGASSCIALRSKTQVRIMLDELRESTEDPVQVDLARKHLHRILAGSNQRPDVATQ